MPDELEIEDFPLAADVSLSPNPFAALEIPDEDFLFDEEPLRDLALPAEAPAPVPEPPAPPPADLAVPVPPLGPPGPWNEWGFSSRPPWWFYPEVAERRAQANAAPVAPSVHEDAAIAAAEAALFNAPPPPRPYDDGPDFSDDELDFTADMSPIAPPARAETFLLEPLVLEPPPEPAAPPPRVEPAAPPLRVEPAAPPPAEIIAPPAQPASRRFEPQSQPEDVDYSDDEPPEDPGYPPDDDDSPKWAEYWSRKNRYDAYYAGLQRQGEAQSASDSDSSDSDSNFHRRSAAAISDVPPPRALATAQHDFRAPGITDGSWNRSDHVRKICNVGFSFSPDVRLRGKKPRPMRLEPGPETDYVRQLIADGILERGHTVFCVPHFFVYQPGKLRLIFNGKKLNRASKKPPPFNMKSHQAIQRLAARFSWHAADDLKNHFFSTKIAESSRKFFGFATPFGTFRYTSLPFGFSWSPFIAHVCVDEVCKRAIEAGFHVTHYLDDFHYFGSSLSEVEAARDFTRALLRQAGYRINMAKEQPPGDTFTALGLAYDLTAKTVKPKAGYLSGLVRLHTKRLAQSCAVTRAEIASSLGAFVFLNNAYPGSLSHLSPLIEFLKTGGANWRLRYNYASVAKHIQHAIELFEKLPPCPLQQVTAAAFTPIFTDASETGLGVILPDKVLAYGVPTPKTIYRLEADAASWALQMPLPKYFTLRIDNEALVHALQKGRSNIVEANLACARLFELRLRGHIATAKWIATDKNPADAPSRLRLRPRELFVSPSLPQCVA